MDTIKSISFCFFIHLFLFPNITFSATTQQWATLCKSWGLLKYFAPNSEKESKIHIDWDKELLNSFDAIYQTNSTIELNNIVTNWITKGGKYDEGISSMLEKNSFDNIDLVWLEKDTSLNEINKEYLKKLRWRKSPKENYYVTIAKEKAPYFGIENQYEKEENLSNPYQILALFRLWNIIDVFFPYKNLMTTKWSTTLDEFIPLFLKKQSREQYLLNLKKIGHFLEDAHVYIEDLDVKEKNKVVPFLTSYVNGKQLIKAIIKNTKANEFLQKGDVIVEINGIAIQKLRDSLRTYVSYANPLSAENKIDILIYNYQKASVNFYKITRNNKDTLSFEIPNISADEWNKNLPYDVISKPYEVTTDNIGILYLGEMTDKDFNQAIKKMENTKGIIIDLSRYPNIDYAERFISYFIDKEKIDYITIKAMQSNELGIFNQLSLDFKLPKSKFKYKGKVVVLISPFGTISYGETIATLLKTHTDAVFIGRKTAATNGNVAFCHLPYKAKIAFTSMWVGFPNGSPYQKVGIEPDIKVEPNEQDLLNFEDSRLKKAIEFLNQSK